jgi:hypothetical protein
MWKETVMAQSEVLARHLSGGTGENNDNLSQDNRSTSQDFCLQSPMCVKQEC